MLNAQGGWYKDGGMLHGMWGCVPETVAALLARLSRAATPASKPLQQLASQLSTSGAQLSHERVPHT